MADYTRTAANVHYISGKVRSGTAGATLTRGMPVYENYDDREFYPCDADAGDTSRFAGVVLNDCADGEPCQVALPGAIIDPGLSSLAVNDVVIASTTAGELAPVADLASGKYLLIVYVAIGTSRAEVVGFSSGEPKA